MESKILVFLITGLIISISISIYFAIELYKTKNKKKDSKIDIEHSSKSLSFFNDLLLLKYQFYFTSDILAYFLSDKEIPKKEITELKEKFYLDISKSLNNDQRNNLLLVFSVEGVKLYIHQTFLRLLNESNIKYLKTDSGSLDKKALDAVYDINKNGG